MQGISKRTKITLTSIIIALGIFTLPSVSFSFKLAYIILLVITTYGLSFWALYWEENFDRSSLKRIQLVTLFVLPVLITLNAALISFEFDFVTQSSFLINLLSSLAFGSLIYVTLLVENIFNVSSGRNIPLLRAGHAVGYLATLVVVFVQSALLHNLGMNPLLLVGSIFIGSFVLILQALWQTELEDNLTFDLFLSTTVFGLVVAEISLMVIFWPLTSWIFGLVNAVTIYLLIGLKQHQIKANLTKSVIREYMVIMASIFLFILFFTGWHG